MFHYIPEGELKLPTPPVNHTWRVQNIITTKKFKTKYIVRIQLLNLGEVPVLTITEEWDRKREQYRDFAMGVAGLALVELDAYFAFLSIDWGRDNNNLIPETWNGDKTNIIEWSPAPSLVIEKEEKNHNIS